MQLYSVSFCWNNEIEKFWDNWIYCFILFVFVSVVSEMLQCARQCGRRNGASPFLTFGEFCVFAREMQKPEYRTHRKPQAQKNSSKFQVCGWITKHNCELFAECIKKCEVFLGGSCNPTTWRTDTAIPELQKYGISYYNPVSWLKFKELNGLLKISF